MNKKQNVLVLIIAVLVIIILYMLYLGLNQKLFLKEKAPIKLGFVGLEGQDSSNALEAIKIAVEEINELDGIKGSKVELIVYAPKSRDEVELYFKKLAEEDKVLAVITTLVNNSDVHELLKIPTILLGPNVLSVARKEPFYWSIENSYSLGDYLFRVMHRINFTLQPKSAFTITDFSPFTRRYQIVARRQITSAGINDLGYHTFYEQNLSNIVDDIKRRNPELIVVNTNTENAIKFFKEAKKQELQPVLYLGGFEVPKDNLLQNIEVLPENLYLSSYITAGPHDSNTKPNNEFDVVDNKLIKKTGNYMDTLSLNAYDSTYILKDVIEKSRIINKESTLDEDRAKLISNLWAGPFYKSLRGTLAPDGKSGFLRRSYSTILIVKDGQYKVWIP